MNKQEVKDTILNKINYKKPFTYGDIIKEVELEPTDIIMAGWDEGFMSENNSISGHYFMKVIRLRLETDLEFTKRKVKAEKEQIRMKERRRETYFKLKEEFDND